MTKRTRESDEKNAKLESLLAEADKSAESQEIVKPTAAEKAGISGFCAITLKVKAAQAEAKEALKDVKPRVKELRKTLLETLKNGSEEILQIPTNMRKEANIRLHESRLPPVPAYIRLSKNTKDVTITNEIIQEAFSSLSSEDILQAEGEGADSIVNAVLSAVRRLVRSFTEQIKLADSVPRGKKAADVELASVELAREAIALHEHSSFILQREKEKRDEIASARQDLESKAQDVEKFFSRANLTSQRVNLENKAYNLCCRTTMIRPKLTLKLLEDFLQDGIKECILSSINGKVTKQSIASALKSKKADLFRIINTRVGTLESTSKTVVHLQKVAEKSDKKDE